METLGREDIERFVVGRARGRGKAQGAQPPMVAPLASVQGPPRCPSGSCSLSRRGSRRSGSSRRTTKTPWWVPPPLPPGRGAAQPRCPPHLCCCMWQQGAGQQAALECRLEGGAFECAHFTTSAAVLAPFPRRRCRSSMALLPTRMFAGADQVGRRPAGAGPLPPGQ